jgi:hypothetical protein
MSNQTQHRVGDKEKELLNQLMKRLKSSSIFKSSLRIPKSFVSRRTKN